MNDNGTDIESQETTAQPTTETPLIKTEPIVIPASVADPVIDSKIKELSKGAKIPGFRPGKIPTKELKARFGGHATEEALKEIASNMFYQLQAAGKVNSITQPVITLNQMPKLGEDYHVNAHYEEPPQLTEFAFNQWEKKLQKPIWNKQESDTEKTLDRILRQAGQYTNTQEPAGKNDQILLNFKAIDSTGKVLETQDKSLWQLNSDALDEKVRDALIGAKAGESKKVQLGTEPDKQVNLEMHVLEVKQSQPAQLDQTLFDKFDAKIKDATGFTKYIEQQLEIEISHNLQNLRKSLCFDYLLANTENFPLPATLLHQEIQMVTQQEQQLRERQGIAEQISTQAARNRAEQRVRLGFILRKISSQFKIDPDDNDLREHIKKRMQFNNQISDDTQLQNEIDAIKANAERLQTLQLHILENKIIDFCYQSAPTEELSLKLDEIIKYSN